MIVFCAMSRFEFQAPTVAGKLLENDEINGSLDKSMFDA